MSGIQHPEVTLESLHQTVVQLKLAFENGGALTPPSVAGKGRVGAVGTLTHSLDAHMPAQASVGFNQKQAVGFVFELRTDDPPSPVPGQAWCRIDLI